MAVWLLARVYGSGLGLKSRLYAGSVCDDSATEVAVVALYTVYLLICFSSSAYTALARLHADFFSV